MPITQSRLLSLLEAGEHFQFLFDLARDQITSAYRQSQTGQVNTTETLANLVLELQATPTVDAQMTLREERLRYKLTQAKNASDRRRKARLRGQDGTEPIPTPDDDLSDIISLPPSRPGHLSEEEFQRLMKEIEEVGAEPPGPEGLAS